MRKISLFIFLFYLFITTFVGCQEKEIDYRKESNFNQAIDITKYYLDVLNDDFSYGISVAEEIATAWEEAIDIYGVNWGTAFTNLYLPTLWNRNKFTFKPYALSGDEILALINFQSPYLPMQVNQIKDLYVLFLHVKDMLEEPSGSLISYRRDISETKSKFVDLYRATKFSISNTEKISVEETTCNTIPKNLNFWGITKGTTYNQAVDILTSKNLEFSNKSSFFPSEKIIELKDTTYYDVDWWSVEIHFINDAVYCMDFNYTELDMSFTKFDVVTEVGDYHDVINTPFFTNFYYVKTEFKDSLTNGVDDFFTSTYCDNHGNYLELHRYGGTRTSNLCLFSNSRDEGEDELWNDFRK